MQNWGWVRSLAIACSRSLARNCLEVYAYLGSRKTPHHYFQAHALVTQNDTPDAPRASWPVRRET